MVKIKTKELLSRLNQKIDSVQNSDEFKKILKTLSKFHNYSYQNSILIRQQNPEATLVAGFKQWQNNFDRHVKKGEKAIAILAPFTYKKTVTEEKEVKGGIKEVEKEVKRMYFRPVYVFDVSQTEGKPLPRIDITVKDSNDKLLLPLKKFLQSKEISLEIKELKRGLKGYSKGGKIVVDKKLNDTEKAGVIVHETAHELLHDKGSRKKMSKEIKEMEAEAAAFIVMEHYGVEIKSDKYLALYKKSYDLNQSLKRISKIASEIIGFLDDYLLNKSSENKKLKEVV
ncbi:ArdC-like ssDNA-binding domain-containing protein [Halanaerobium hydrogeniformans]|uniref:N-terminal domain-containing protein n=1 Tax=Halanaerobium hydrogeniformans TaxID=656519 RepID=E4RNA3_HALHG|nr:ArdC-like ssDNA-binding domain-containing protein [Halanaerobium hydrogeniformans]ADQ13571.1 hypothetical protein Halsa_0075 [Halanaerobium hydrogeniformans]